MDSSSVARYLRLEVHFPQEGFIVGLGVQYIREGGHVKMVRLEFALINRLLELIQSRTFETSVSLIVYQKLMGFPSPFLQQFHLASAGHPYLQFYIRSKK